MRFAQAVPGHFFVREPFQGFRGFGASEADVQTVTDAIVDGRAAQDDFIRAVNELNSRCGGNLAPSLMARLQQLTTSDQQAEIALNAAVDSYLRTGAPSVQNIVDMVNGRIQAINALYPDIVSATCAPSVTTTTEPDGGTTGGGSTGGGTTGSGTTGGGGGGTTGGGMIIPPSVKAGLGLGTWLLGGGLLAAMLFLSKRQKQKPRKKAAKKPRRRITRRRMAPRRAARRRR